MVDARSPPSLVEDRQDIRYNLREMQLAQRHLKVQHPTVPDRELTMAVKLNAKNVSLGVTDTVVVKSAELINTLIANRDEALQFLSNEVAPIQLSEVQVDEYGTVVISSAGFKAAIADKLSGVGPLSNGTCGLAC